ncbi:hypothetical protein DIURU_005709 [Diutina rugosa]|uniref:Putative tyrosine-protein phosphatase OCA1 n=1 Tax=Diutina rugosa TaxID=5481 RepID=A0A642UCF9_DIURU|nr:uncharacterized protein DIURU_005709 [Diutina rugosa]KAA8896697.1 hypothetical protein DIURU_005709 [Diutina rugosa]
MLVPPDNFGLVEPGIYRCTKIDGDNFPFLETLSLKSLVLLDAEKPPRTVINFLESNDVELFTLGEMKISNHNHAGKSPNKADVPQIQLPSSQKSRNDQWMLLEKNLIVKAFEILFNKDRHNMLLVDSTSTLVGILRKIQKWDFNSVLNEYRIYSGGKSSYYAATFLELVQVELVAYESEKRGSVDQDAMSGELRALIPGGGLELHHESVWEEEEEDFSSPSLSYDDDDIDDDKLSASPQIPANLLKMVEQRKHEKNSGNGGVRTPESSPVSRGSFYERRRSSVQRLRPSFSGSVPRLVRGFSFNTDFSYYKNNCRSQYQNVQVIRLKLPPEYKLPEWFIRGRNFWEQNAFATQ